MMKKRLALGTAALGALVLAASINAFAADISNSRAKEIALEHAKVAEADLAFSRVETDYEDRRLVYDVEFVTNSGAEYDYEIEAATGTILKYDYDAESHTSSRRSRKTEKLNSASGKTAETVSASGQNQISAEEAKGIALNRAGISESQATRLSVKKDWDDGRAVYEGKFFYSELEYEFELDAQSGTILEWDVESIYD